MFVLETSRVVDGGQKHEVVEADGTQLHMYGFRTVMFQLLTGGQATIKFHVMNVLRPTLSVSRLVQTQFVLVFGKQAFLERDGQRVALVRIAGLYYLPVYLKTPRDHQETNLDFWQKVRDSYADNTDRMHLMMVTKVPWSLIQITRDSGQQVL
jgi:hypothetical protein